MGEILHSHGYNSYRKSGNFVHLDGCINVGMGNLWKVMDIK